MAGQGSLCRRWIQSGAAASALGWMCAIACGVASATESNVIDVRMRFQWQAPSECYWKAQLEVTGGSGSMNSIQEVVDQGSSDLTGAMELLKNPAELSNNPTNLVIQPRFTKTGGTVEFRVRGDRDSKLAIRVSRFKPSEGASVDHLPSRELTLAELVENPEILSEAEAGTESERPSWTLNRVQGDPLRLEGLNVREIVQPGQEINYSVRCNALMSQSSQLHTLQASVIRVSDGETIHRSRHLMQIDARGDSPPVSISFSAPDEAGVYEVRSVLIREDENIWSRIRRRDIPLLSVAQPIIVHGPREQPSEGVWNTVEELRPSESSWSVTTWIPQSTSKLIPGAEPISRPSPSPKESYHGKTVSLIATGESFQTALPIQSIAKPHRITLRVAQDRDIQLRVQIGDGKETDRSFVIRHSSHEDPQNPWLEHTWIHYPGDHPKITLTNESSEPAGVESILIEAGPSRLDVSNDTSASDATVARRKAYLHLTDDRWHEGWSRNAERGRSDFADETVFVHQVWTATRRLADYAHSMRWTGVILPGSQATVSDLGHVDVDAVDLALNFWDRDSVQVFASVPTHKLLEELEHDLRLQPDFVAELSRDEINRSEQYNLLSKNVQARLAAWLSAIDRNYSRHTAYSGLNLIVDQDSHLRPPIGVERDPRTLSRFSANSQASLEDVSQPELMTTQTKSALKEWLRKETRDAYDVITSGLSERPAMLVMSADDAVDWLPKNLGSSLNESNWTLIPKIDNGDPEVLAERQRLRQGIANLKAVAGQPVLGVHVDSSDATFQEAIVRPEWYSDLSRAIDQLEPRIVLLDESIAHRQSNRSSREWVGAVTSIPVSPMAIVPSSDPASETVHVRSTRVNNRVIISMTSLVPWPTEVDVETSGPSTWRCSSPKQFQARSQTRIRVKVPAGQLVVLEAMASETPLRIVGWTARVGGGIDTLKRIKRQVTTVVERIGILSDLTVSTQLRNGGFEQSGKMGPVGWLHAQHPPGCVSVDEQQKATGRQSIRLTTDPQTSQRTWIVSERIPPPQTGRLAVSLSCRGELVEDAMPHRLKVSIEATCKGRPLRIAKEFEVPRNGQWITKQGILEASDFDCDNVDSLRLTIDSLSAGQVWIDDVQLHENFATQFERDNLQSLAFLAVQGLQRGNLAPAGRLLQDHWAQHLLGLKDVAKPIPAQASEPPAEESPGVAERLRTWLPAPLRF